MDPTWCPQKWKNIYLNEMGIEHSLTTPPWPRANGEVERQHRSLLKVIRVVHAEKRDWKLEYLLVYRTTPHVPTCQSPAQLLFGRNLSTKWSEVVDLRESEDPG